MSAMPNSAYWAGWFSECLRKFTQAVDAKDAAQIEALKFLARQGLREFDAENRIDRSIHADH